MRKAAYSIILLFTIQLHAQCPHETTLFYGNGMFNSNRMARDSLVNLTSKLKETSSWKKERSYVAYNYNETAVVELLEVAQQKLADFNKDFYRWLYTSEDMPDWYKEAFKKALSARDFMGFARLELSEQLMLYENEMDLDRSIVVVAHSQGNFFANGASLRLQSELYPASTKFKIIAVATPTAYVNDDGPYFTLTSDGIISMVPLALKANATNTAPKPKWPNHAFDKFYLNGIPTGEKIISAAQKTFTALEQQEEKDNKLNKECWQWFESLNLPKGDSQECEIKCNVEKNDMSNFNCPSLCEAFCACSSKRAKASLPN